MTSFNYNRNVAYYKTIKPIKNQGYLTNNITVFEKY